MNSIYTYFLRSGIVLNQYMLVSLIKPQLIYLIMSVAVNSLTITMNLHQDKKKSNEDKSWSQDKAGIQYCAHTQYKLS